MTRLPRSTYALLVSLLPATATVVGLVVVGQVPTPVEVVGVVLVIAGWRFTGSGPPSHRCGPI